MNKFGLPSILIAVVLLLVAVLADAQQPKVYRVGVLLPSALGSEIVDGLRAGLKEWDLKRGNNLSWKSGIQKAI